MVEEIFLENINELFDFFSVWHNDYSGWIFRGHKSEQFKLIPSILRVESAKIILKKWTNKGIQDISELKQNNVLMIRQEFNLLRNFFYLADQRGLFVPKSQILEYFKNNNGYVPELSNPYPTKLWIPDDLYTLTGLAQHYGIQTRFLDWTFDPYVSLFFALRYNIKSDENACVWMLHKNNLIFSLPSLTGLQFIVPDYNCNPFLHAQKGLFSHWKIKVPNSPQIAHNDSLIDRRCLTEQIIEDPRYCVQQKNIFKKIIIPNKLAKKSCEILKKMGYDFSSIYPGYSGVAKEINNCPDYTSNIGI